MIKILVWRLRLRFDHPFALLESADGKRAQEWLAEKERRRCSGFFEMGAFPAGLRELAGPVEAADLKAQAIGTSRRSAEAQTNSPDPFSVDRHSLSTRRVW